MKQVAKVKLSELIRALLTFTLFLWLPEVSFTHLIKTASCVLAMTTIVLVLEGQRGLQPS